MRDTSFKTRKTKAKPRPGRAATLRAQALALPTSPGVYRFHGPDTEVPIYIGKSINLRKRVLSHLTASNTDSREHKLVSLSTRISYTQTTGELTALLQESQEVKQRQPLMNRRLRRRRQLFTYQVAPSAQGAPESTVKLVPAIWPPALSTATYFGLYSSKTQAQRSLRDLAARHQLCLVVLGLEKSTRGCFGYQLNRCEGACVGKETEVAHSKRLQAAVAEFAIRVWPYPGPIGIQESTDATQINVIDQWYHLGAYESSALAENGMHHSPSQPTLLDRDAYRIVSRWLCAPPEGAKIIPL